MNKRLSSLVLTPPLFFVALVCFFWGNNAHMYQPDSLIASFLAVIAIAAVAAAIGFAIRHCWDRLGLDKYWLARLIAGAALAVGILVLINVVFRDPLKIMAPTNAARHLFRIVVFVPLFSLLFFRLRQLTRVVNIFLLASMCLSILMAASVFLKDSGRDVGAADAGIPIVLKKTPNIYLFWMESFHEPRIIDRYYGTSLVRDGFPAGLEKRGFRLFENTYSNSHGTLASMADVFSMRLSRSREAGMLDVMPGVRRMLGGSDENTLLKILKANGYFTAYITGASPYCHNGDIGPYLDSTDYVLPAGSLYYYLRPAWELNPRRLEKRLFESSIGDATRDIDGGYSGNTSERLRHAQDLAKNSGKPLFVSFKGGAMHTDGSQHTWRQEEEWLPKYRDAVQTAIPEAMEIIDMITASDPDAAIVLLGDHGPARLRKIWTGVDVLDIPLFAAHLQQNGESLESLADDLFNVICAIRIPDMQGSFGGGGAS